MTEKKYNEIDVIALALQVLKEWKTLIKFAGIAAVIGVVVALNTPKTYTAEVVLAPEMSSGGIGLSESLTDMASTFGIDLGSKSSMDAIYPEIYPDIFESTDFVRSLFDVPVRLKDDNTTRTYIEHLTKDTKSPFWTYPKIWLAKMLAKPEVAPKGGSKDMIDPYRIPKIEGEICENISKSITCIIDKKTSEITISIVDQDPMVAAIMVDTLQMRLQAYITNYRTMKARIDYEYYDKMVKDAEKNYIKSKVEYTSYSDSHFNSVLSSVSAQEQTLKDNMASLYASYSGMTKMREQALAKIQERTPAFTIIKSAKMPHKASSTPRLTTLILFVFCGIIADIIWILVIKQFFVKAKEV